ncbi:MAG: hypothetical protein Q9212_007473, partial [Teloschistes hypoglaucus]
MDNIVTSLLSGKDRIKKASQTVIFSPGESNILGVDEQRPEVRALREKLRKNGYLAHGHQVATALDWFVKTLAQVHKNTPQHEISLLISFASQFEGKFGELLHPTFKRRVKKLATYRIVVDNLWKTVKDRKIESIHWHQ